MRYKKDPPEFRLLLTAIRIDDAGRAAEEAEKILNTESIDWDDLYERAALHCIRPQVENMLNRVSCSTIPDHFREKLNSANRENLLSQLRNMAGFFEIKALLDAQQIEAVPFKGFWLAQEMYGNLADRETRDIDLYIHLHDLDPVIALMHQSGYRAETSDSPRFIEKVKKKSAEYNFARYEGDSSINHFEFHWKIGSALLGMDISLKDLASQVVPGTLQDHDISVFTPSASLLLAIMHHGGKDPMIQLKHILDIGMIIKKHRDLDWSWIMRMAKRFKMEKVVNLGVRLASDLTGVEVPEQAETEFKVKSRVTVEASAIKKLAAERVRLMSLPPDQWYTAWFNYRNLLFHLQSRTGFRLRAAMIRQSCWSSVVGFLAPEKVLRFYLKKRYRIDREAV